MIERTRKCYSILFLCRYGVYKFLSCDVFQVHIEFNDDQNKIVIEGPPEEVAAVESKIKEQKDELVSLDCSLDSTAQIGYWHDTSSVCLSVYDCAWWLNDTSYCKSV